MYNVTLEGMEKTHTANGGSSPFYTDSRLIAGCSVGCNCWAEAFTVSSCIARTCVFHTSIIIALGIHLKVWSSCHNKLVMNFNIDLEVFGFFMILPLNGTEQTPHFWWCRSVSAPMLSYASTDCRRFLLRSHLDIHETLSSCFQTLWRRWRLLFVGW